MIRRPPHGSFADGSLSTATTRRSARRTNRTTLVSPSAARRRRYRCRPCPNRSKTGAGIWSLSSCSVCRMREPE